jgi:phosphoenolpyruvate carboxykinase (GTP)
MRNERLEAWILLVAAHTSPSRIHWCDGSDAELAELRESLQADGTLLRLNEDTYPGCFLHRTQPKDAVPAEHRFVSTASQLDAGPTNQWLSEDDAYRVVWPLFAKAMSGRTLYVVPYLLASPRSKYAQVGVQLTDSPLVVLMMAKLTRMGRVALQHLGRSSDFVRGVHSLAAREAEGGYLVRFPATQTCWSIGTAYPKDATLFESHVLALAGSVAPEEGYLAEHMSVARVVNPDGVVRYIAAAFPSGCGKTRLASMLPSASGWQVKLVADGACLLRVGEDGRLWALNPAAGIDGRVGGGCLSASPGNRTLLARDSIFINTALRRDGSPWWEGSREPAGEGVLDWQGRAWRPGSDAPAAHPNARFIVAAQHFPHTSGLFYDAEGVPLSAILFGGRRRALVPLIFEATSWEHGVYVAATSRSEVAHGSARAAGALYNDPMGMLPFCSYNMADYFGHWLRLGSQLLRPPHIFHVNWFRSDERGRLLWPGFGENIRVLDWVLQRVERRVDARRTAIGCVPHALDTTGLDLDADTLDQLLQVDVRGWLQETEVSGEFLAQFGDCLPRALQREQQALVRRLLAATN